MARAPFNVAILPYQPLGDGQFRYALLKRRDAGFWQGVSGGGEDDETPLEAAVRETWEEIGVRPATPMIQLDTVDPLPVTIFTLFNDNRWPPDLYIVPQYWFGALIETQDLTLSHEHTEYRWLDYQTASHMLKYDGNKVALWELDARLRGRGPRG